MHVGIHVILFLKQMSQPHIALHDSILELKMKTNADKELSNLLPQNTEGVNLHTGLQLIQSFITLLM